MIRYGLFICIVTGMFMLASAVHAQSTVNPLASEPGFWDIGDVQIQSVPDFGGVNRPNFDPCESSPMSMDLQKMEIGWDEIINIGVKVWDIIKENKPVVQVQTPMAHALPRGLGCWTDLEQWHAPRTQSYEVVYKNKFGMEVIRFRYRVQFTYGGTSAGLGRYIANATVMPGQLDVLWGYNFGARIDVGRVVNVGTKESPIAGLEMDLHWNVKTWVMESENSVHFFATGNGDLSVAN